MLEKELTKYFDCIEPSPDLIERTINMSKESNKTVTKISKRAMAILVAAVVLAVGITGFASITRIKNDNKGIVSEQNSENSGGFVFNFSKASRTPEKYSSKDKAIVMELNAMKHSNILLPAELLDDTYEIYNTLNPFLTENGSCIQMKNTKYDVSLNLIGGLTPAEMDGYIGTGDEQTICNVINVNGIDVCICIEGADDVGYSAYIFYAVDDTLYWINYFAGESYDVALNSANEFASTLKQ